VSAQPATTAAIGPTTTTTTTSIAAIGPIAGYGDFSDQEYFVIDWFLVTRLEVQCLQDQGFPVMLIPPGDGISFQSVPQSQNELAVQYFEACRAGLGIPDYEPASPEQIEMVYWYYIALRDCLIDEGYTVSEPPSLDTFVESWASGPWSPYENVSPGAGWDAIQMKCPQSPPGGFGAWQPGDPIVPIAPPGDS